jgi:hypothetical protein
MIDKQDDINGWLSLAEGLYEILNRRETTIQYTFEEVKISVPQSIGVNAPKAEWGIHGTVRLSTHEKSRSEGA